MKYLLLLSVLAIHLSLSHACRCPVATLKKSFYSPSNKRFVRATVLFKNELPQERRYLLRITTVYKGCSKPYVIWVVSKRSHAECGVDLTERLDYVMPLSFDNRPTINSCQFIRQFEELSSDEYDFLKRREVCCNGLCACADGKPPVSCVIPPCDVSEPPCGDAYECRNNYCGGGCHAEWFTAAGKPACC